MRLVDATIDDLLQALRPMVRQEIAEVLQERMGDPRVFPWDHATTWLDHELLVIQQAAGIHLPCTSSDSHDCTPKCHVYTLHDFRRAHATYMYGAVSDRELQRQMGHASFATTRSYAKYAEAHRQTPYNAYLPAFAKAKAQGLKLADIGPNGGQEADKTKTA
jgi:integrase